MTITTDFNTINANYDQAEIALKYQLEFKNVHHKMSRLSNEIESIVSSTQFTAIPTDVKQSLNAFWQLIKNFNTAVESDITITEMLGWAEESIVEP